MNNQEVIKRLCDIQDLLQQGPDVHRDATLNALAIGYAINALKRWAYEGASAATCGCGETHQQDEETGTFRMTYMPCEKHKAMRPILHYVRCLQAAQKLGVEEFIRRVAIESGMGDKVELR